MFSRAALCKRYLDHAEQFAEHAMFRSLEAGRSDAAGYDVFLVLEATIGFNKREDNEEDDGQDESETVELEPAPESGRRRLSKIKLTSQDQKFLRALKISIDEEKH